MTCKYYITDDKTCKNKAKKNCDYCSFHQNKQDSEMNKIQLTKYKELLKLQTQLTEKYKEGYENYSFISYFEQVKYKLNQYVDIKDINQLSRFLKHRDNRELLKTIMPDKGDCNYLTHFNKLRIKRNKLSHYGLNQYIN